VRIDNEMLHKNVKIKMKFSRDKVIIAEKVEKTCIMVGDMCVP